MVVNCFFTYVTTGYTLSHCALTQTCLLLQVRGTSCWVCMWKAKVEISYLDLNHLGHKSYTWTPASPATSPYLPLLLLLFFFLMLVNRHLQKVLFTADEAHCASHPSRARAERTRPNPSKTPPLGPPLLSPPLLSSPLVGELLGLYSAQTGDKCAQSGWHHCGVTGGGLKESSG